jgi:hypothetical protein
LQATEYFNNLLRELAKAVEAGASEQIKDRSFWKEDKDTAVGNLDFMSFMVRQSASLKDLGGVLKDKGTFHATWYPPKGSQLYRLCFFGHGGKHGLYYLLYLKDGREFILKVTAKSIRIVDHLSPYAYRQLMIEIFWKLFHEKGRVGKVIRRFSRTGGYK